MTIITKVTCHCDGKEYPIDECCPLLDGGYVHEDNLNEYVSLPDSYDGVYIHRDDAIYCECNNFYYPENDMHNHDIEWDHYDECWRFTYNMVFGQTGDGEGWFNENCEYVYSESRDRYYINGDVAREYDMEYCDRREDWVHIDDLDDDEEWSNQFKVNSKTFKKTHGMKYTFGVEIETCDGYMEYNPDLSLSCVNDGSIEGMEYVTGVLQGDKGLEMLKSICNALHDDYCYVDRSCGLHVHIGGANFNRKFSILSLMLGQIIQDELFTMLPKSRLTSTYCYKIKDKYENIQYVNKKLYPRTHDRTLKLLAEYVHNDTSRFGLGNNKNTPHPYGRYASSRYTWLNLNNCSYKFSPDTIEFRCHSGTTDYDKMYNWILICMCFVSFVENNPRFIIEAFKNYNKYSIVDRGNLDLSDIINVGLANNQEEASRLKAYISERKEKFKQD